jgi:hypothetical protein
MEVSLVNDGPVTIEIDTEKGGRGREVVGEDASTSGMATPATEES